MREQYAHFEATLENLEPIATFISTFFLQDSALSDEKINNFEVSVDEHISNLVEHALKDATDSMLTITCRDDSTKAQVIIADKTAGFDPRNYTVPDLNGKAIYEIPPGGFGNYFICELMDDVEYTHHPFVNNELILTVYKDQT
ncbi:hypothetical protein GF339_18280 [candidate division KSB3 bacterium]|uniref:Histidine kinase/HSP90-like ATPase domain-containing protein n=1 Tax=candidate division KSB3 bacterium TaxID=2044937 RepID=A0A9D5JYM8_9BACT|nr:hypothetical protein [candidate division KSB3 bacterium]MBD3326538.1 hypothetical protein [candidate division KSB3 bacterium]